MENTNQTPVHSLFLVVGAGQIGTPLVKRLLDGGHRVTWVSRRAPKTVPAGAHHVSLDASDGVALGELARGARAILVAANPSTYDAKVWARTLPPLHAGVIEAAARSGARLVLLDALYAYALDRGPLSPDTPQLPSTAKGKVRKQLADMVREAQQSGRTRITTLRASDFWGPGLASALVGQQAIEDIKRGRAATVIGDPDVPHAFSHRDDVVEALYALALAEDDVEGRVFHAPVIHVTPRQLLEAVAGAFGTRARARTLPPWLLRAVGLLSPTVNGLVEMLPQWQAPYLVDDSSYTERFGKRATPLARGAAQLAA